MPYIGRSTDGFGVRNRFLYLASADDTSVSGADANGATLTFTDGAYVDVYLNGVLLKAGTDYNTNTANTIASLAAMAANDEVTVVVYDVFTVGDMVSATSGGTFSGNVTVNGDLTIDTDTLKVDASEDTVCINTTATNFDDGADDLIVGGGTGDSGITIYTGANVGDKGSIFFADGTTGSSAEKKGQISYEQNNEIMTFFTNDTLAMQIDLNGHVTMPKQSAFQARPTSQISNVTDGSSQTLAFATEIFDQNSDYNDSNYNFVAPVTGKYLLTLMLRVQSVDTASQYFQTIILTSNKEYQSIFSSNVLSSDPTYWDTIVSVVADMDKDDTAIPRVFIEGSGAAQVDIETDSYFSGCLLA